MKEERERRGEGNEGGIKEERERKN